MVKIISLVNKKGGSGKTTSTLEVAYNLSVHSNKRILIVDLDSQASSTSRLLQIKDGEQFVGDTIGHLMSEEIEVERTKKAIQECTKEWPNIFLLPSSIELASLETDLEKQRMREFRLKKVLSPFQDYFDYILIDLPPGMNCYIINALVASTDVIVTAETSDYALDGVRFVHSLIKDIKKEGLNSELEFSGVLINQLQKLQSISVKQLVDTIEKEFGNDKLNNTRVPHSTKVLDSQRQYCAVSKLAPNNPVSVAYKNISSAIVNNF